MTTTQPAPVTLQGLTTALTSQIGRFIVLLGAPFTGKTTSALTFPNPVVLNFDNKIPAGTAIIPFHDDAFVDSIMPRANRTLPANRRDAMLHWLGANISKLQPDQTLIIDSMTSWNMAIHLQCEYVEHLDQHKNQFELWKVKNKYLTTAFELMQSCKASIILTCHTLPEYDAESGKPTGKIEPLIEGAWKDKIVSRATDIFRQYIKLSTNNQPAQYMWRIKPDRVFNSNTFLLTDTTDIPATYQALAELISSTKVGG